MLTEEQEKIEALVQRDRLRIKLSKRRTLCDWIFR
jgi:hypothetical protein